MIKFTVILLFSLFLFTNSVVAEQLYSDQPLCLTITNAEDRTVYGYLETAWDAEVEKRHRSEFRLASGETTDACSTGPYYEGYRLKFTVMSLFPLFHCNTLANHDIIIKRNQLPDGSYQKNDKGFTIWAECY